MATRSKSITLLGSHSGRNAGDAAILQTVVVEIIRRRPGTRFEVPTTAPDFIRACFPEGHVVPVGVMPWHLSVRLFGLPTLLSLRRTDLSLILDGIIFDHRLLNPAFNFLITLAPLAAWSRFVGRPMVCFEVGVGPLRTPLGRRLARNVAEDCALVMAREEDTVRLLREVGVVKTPVELYADAVFIITPAAPARVDEIVNGLNLQGRPMAGLNLTRYGGQWMKEKGFDLAAFQRRMAGFVDRFAAETGAVVVLTGTQYMDHDYLTAVRDLVSDREAVRLVTNRELLPEELAGLMGRMEMFIGMRLHSLILASSQKTPILGLTYAPKVKSLFDLCGRPELALDLGKVDGDTLLREAVAFWKRRDEERRSLAPIIDEQKKKAAAGFDRLVEKFL